MVTTNDKEEIGLEEAILRARGASTGSVTIISKEPDFQLGLGSNVETVARNIRGMRNGERTTILRVLENHIGGVTINC